MPLPQRRQQQRLNSLQAATQLQQRQLQQRSSRSRSAHPISIGCESMGLQTCGVLESRTPASLDSGSEFGACKSNIGAPAFLAAGCAAGAGAYGLAGCA